MIRKQINEDHKSSFSKLSCLVYFIDSFNVMCLLVNIKKKHATFSDINNLYDNDRFYCYKDFFFSQVNFNLKTTADH